MLLKTGQTTCYHVFDDGDYEEGIAKGYTTLTTGDYSGNTNIEVAHYAAATISFDSGTKKIADSADGLVTVLTDDTIVVKGSTDNDGTYTVATGGVAGEIVVNEALTDEAAGAYVSLYKRAAHSNNCVQDDNTGLMWSRNTSNGERVGTASGGLLYWCNTTFGAGRYWIYSAANTISLIMPGNIFRIIGGAALTQFHAGDVLSFSGFANPVNLIIGYRVLSATVNGADLDIVVDPGNNILIAEGAVSDGAVLYGRNIFNYAAGANNGALAGYTDWRVPNEEELQSLKNMEVATAVPDAVAFPAWPASYFWSSTTTPDSTGKAIHVRFLTGQLFPTTKTTSFMLAALVRG